MKKSIITALLALVALTASAQETKKEKKATEYDTEIFANVKDHLTHDKVSKPKGDLLMKADSSFVDTLEINEYDKETYVSFKVKTPGQYIMRIEAEGYVTKYVDVDATKLHKREKFRSYPPVYMRKQPKKLEVELNEVVVKSTRLKFYMDGDTLVYNADAFNMAEGSMLGELIKKMPGVEVEDGGIIKVNGRQVESMLLNGKDFFDKDRELLLENMPSYMVKSFNVYERTPESAIGTAREKSAQKEFVMDVRLKKDYNAGWIANAEAGGGATFFDNANGKKDGKYMGRLFGMRFTKNSRLFAYANANNLNDTRNPGDKGDWAQLRLSEGLTSTVKGGLNYRMEQERELPKRITYEGSIDGAYTDRDNQSHTTSATFLDNGNTFGKSFSNSRSYNWEMNTEHSLMYNQKKVGDLLKNVYIHFTPSLKLQKWNTHSADAGATLSEDVASRLGKAWMDSIAAPDAGDLLKQYAINRTLSARQGSGHRTSAQGWGYMHVYPAYNDFLYFTLNFNGNIFDNGSDTYEHYRLDYPRDEAQTMDYRNRYTPSRQKSQNLTLNPTVSFFLNMKDNDDDQTLTLGYRYQYDHSDNNNPLYLLNRLEGWEQPDSHPLGMLPSAEEMLLAMDMDNSSHAVNTKHTHRPGVSYQFYKRLKDGYTMLNANVGLGFSHETQDYQRGHQIDTLTTRNTALPDGYVSYYFSQSQKGMYIQANYRFSVTAPSMTSLLNIRDDSNPLNITLGNPNLKNTVSHDLRIMYHDKFGKTFVNANLSSKLSTNAVAYGFIYDRETGVRTSKPENVNGNWEIHAEGGIDLPLDKNDRLHLKESVNYDYNHSVDLAGTNGATEATRSTVGSNYLTERLSLRYRPTSKMEFGVNGSLAYQHSTSNRESFETLNVYTYHYGCNAQVELPLGFQVSTDLTLYSRRGYSEPSMNTNELVWNARLAKKLMKGNLTLMFDGFDLLGNLSNVRRTINAQGRTETFRNVIPSYGLLHAVYRLNKQPKNKK